MQSQSDCHRRSREMVADSEPYEVQLTKFSPLPAQGEPLSFVLNLDAASSASSTTNTTSSNSSHSSSNTSTIRPTRQKHQDNIRSLSAGDLVWGRRQQPAPAAGDGEGAKNRKWPWPAANVKRQLEADIVPTVAGGADLSQPQQVAAVARGNEPFQVVWRRLSFEVHQSTYDRLMGASFGKLRSLWRKPCGWGGSGGGGGDGGAGGGGGGGNGLDIVDSKQQAAQQPEGRRVIFENLNGYINSGEISAILGPSGSGKTSLLNAICGRVDNYRGSVQLLGGGTRRMRLSIIPQKDYLIENLTVRENLLYSSKILNASSKFDHESNILRVVKMLNLTTCLNSNAAHISGGEYKRVSIAQELLRQPDILILDEPTSGLDSLNCKNLIKSLVQLIEASRKGAINPIAIVMTIHQPDVDTFQMFDHVYCIARGGQVVFDGHPSEALDVVRTQADLPDEYLPSGTINPANLLIELASGGLYGDEPIKNLAEYQRYQFELNQALHSVHSTQSDLTGNKHFSQDNLLLATTTNNLNRCYLLNSPGGSPRSTSNSSVRTSTRSHQAYRGAHLVRDKRLNAKNDISDKFWYHTGLLTKRAFVSTLRDPMMTLMSLLFHLSIPFVMWTVYPKETGTVKACPVIHREMEVVSMAANQTLSKMEQMQEDFSLAIECSTMFFLSTYSFSLCSLAVAALAFPLNMHILLKEVRNGWYSLPSYVVAKTLANIPFEVLYPTISIMMIYLMLGMTDSYLDWRLWAMALVMAFIAMVSHTQGLIFGAICMDSVQTAIFLGSASTLPMTILSGFTTRIKHMPMVLQKLSFLSLYRYSTESINIIRFGFGICPCDQSTNEYLRNTKPEFKDVPPNLSSLFAYYLTSASDNNSSTDITTTTIPTIVDTVKQLVPGVDYDMNLSETIKGELMKKIEQSEVNIFDRMAQFMSRSFTYGFQVDSCDSFRSQLLISSGAPRDDFLPMLFVGMVCLLVAMKIILFIIVKVKIGGRV